MYDSQKGNREENALSKKLYIGNLNYQTTKEALANFLSKAVADVSAVDVFIIPNKGFGFAEFTSIEDATKVKEVCNGQNLDGRDLRINFAMEQKPRDSRNGGGYNNNSRGGSFSGGRRDGGFNRNR